MENILFLHGWGGGEHSFSNVLPFFQSKYNCICVSLPKDPETPMVLEDYARLVFAELDARGIQKTHIIAHSFGARITALVAAAQPHRIGRIVLIGPAGIKPRFNIWRRLRIRLNKMKIIKSRGSSDYRTLTLSGKITFQNIIKRDLRAEIAKIAAPTLVIWGTKDKSIRKYMILRWTKLNACTTIKKYRGAGHFCFLDSPARFTVDAEEFLDA